MHHFQVADKFYETRILALKKTPQVFAKKNLMQYLYHKLFVWHLFLSINVVLVVKVVIKVLSNSNSKNPWISFDKKWIKDINQIRLVWEIDSSFLPIKYWSYIIVKDRKAIDERPKHTNMLTSFQTICANWINRYYYNWSS